MALDVRDGAAVGTQPLQPRFIRIDGDEVHYREGRPPGSPAQSLPVVVCVHGATSGRIFRPFAERLAARVHVIVPDLPHVGASHDPPQPLDIDAAARWLARFVDALVAAPVHLFGQSTGCNKVVELAARQPGIAASIALQGVTAAPWLRSLWRFQPRWMLNALREASAPPDLAQSMREMPSRQRRELLRSMFDHAIEHSLPGIDCPALVIQGSRDAMVPTRWAAQVALAMPQGRLAVIEGGTHSLVAVAPQAVDDVYSRFLGAALEGAAATDASMPAPRSARPAVPAPVDRRAP